MEFTVKSGHSDKQRSACIVVGVFQSRQLSEAAAQLDKAGNGFLTKLLDSGDMEGRAGQTLLLTLLPNLPCERVLLVGCGPESDFNDRAYRKAVTAMTRALSDSGATEAVSYLSDLNVKERDAAWRIREGILTANDNLYRFDRLKSKKDEQPRPLKSIAFAVSDKKALTEEAQEAQRIAVAIGKGVSLARDLGNLPGNICTPTYLAEQALTLAKNFKTIKTEILSRPEMEALGMGSLLSVARGSREEPKLIVMQYQGGGDSKPIALVGKGITFDTGGISIKPAQTMDEMKYDMCGAASVLGTFQAAAELALPLNVVGIIPSCENMPDGAATKPGDIVTSMSGQTIEILNTDAEGRLILCDALTYSERFEPDAVIDIATLTGACIIALGHLVHGLMGNDDPLIEELLSAGRLTGDRAWELPLFDEYQEALDSNFADVANVGDRAAGTITAASFLSRFTKTMRWAHLDIAGTAWKSGKEKGASGRPVPLLTEFLIQRAART